VLFECSGGRLALAVREQVPFASWASGRVLIGGRGPTLADLTTHLTTVFPPVRLRGFIELRYMDASPPRWWPALATVATVLLDDPVAADAAADVVEATAGLWTEAARWGLRDKRFAESARQLLSIAITRCPTQMATAVADLAELVDSGRSPGDLMVERIEEIGVVAAWDEASHA
jgi:glutamate--cysteine ligase